MKKKGERLHLHTPRAHAEHTGDECGCCLDIRAKGMTKTICKYCGALYDYFEVVTYHQFICYDCEHALDSGPPKFWLKPDANGMITVPE